MQAKGKKPALWQAQAVFAGNSVSTLGCFEYFRFALRRLA